MAITRKKLKAMGLESEQVDQIIEDHLETVEALKEERDTYKTEAEKVKGLEDKVKELEGKEDFETKYNDEHKAFEDYKKEQEGKVQKEAKVKAYQELLKEAGVLEKTIPSILKATSLEEIELDKEGAIKNKEDVVKGVKEEWADFIKETKGANTSRPPETGGTNTTFKEMSLEEKMVYANEHPNDKEVTDWLRE